MKLLLLTLISSITCHRATILERNGNNKNIQGEFGDCIQVSGSAIGQRARSNFEVHYYNSKNCRGDYIYWAYGDHDFNDTINYRSVKISQRQRHYNDKNNIEELGDSVGNSGSNDQAQDQGEIQDQEKLE